MHMRDLVSKDQREVVDLYPADFRNGRVDFA
ncbi:hypothetical protein NA66_100674 [Burkholderia pyrrocinia]|uniref:Uncharacterized protein n=2 Tax=Burkholderiaceae TaxID=119060 RepID=A0A318IRV2_BURPY|nr:hypothetical protein NA66_100674 [Burkholderia pyrrocinia]